jgi:hypothetical protein
MFHPRLLDERGSEQAEHPVYRGRPDGGSVAGQGQGAR